MREITTLAETDGTTPPEVGTARTVTTLSACSGDAGVRVD